MTVRTTVSPHPMVEGAEPHVVRKGAELNVLVSLLGPAAVSRALELVVELVDEGGQAVVPSTEAVAPLSSVTSYMLRPGTTSATLRPRINILSSAFNGSDSPFRLRVSATNDPSVAPALSPRIVVRSKWPSKAKRASHEPEDLPAPPGALPVPTPPQAPHRAERVLVAASKPTYLRMINKTSDDERSNGSGGAAAPKAPLDMSRIREALATDPGVALPAHESGPALEDATDSYFAETLKLPIMPIMPAPAADAVPEGGATLAADESDALLEQLDAADIASMIELLGDDLPSDPPAPTPPHSGSSGGTSTRRERPLAEAETDVAVDEAMEEARRKRKTGVSKPRALVVSGAAGLPVWLTDYNLCASSGFLCMDCVLADPQPIARRALLPSAFEEGPMFKVRWCCNNMNGALGAPFDTLCTGRELDVIFEPSAFTKLGSACAKLAQAEAREALDCGMMGLRVGEGEIRALCHVLLHTDGAPAGSIAVRRFFLTARVHAHASGDGPMRTFEHPQPCANLEPRAEDEVVKQVVGGRLNYVSTNVREQFGYEAWEFLGREAGCSVHPDDAQRWYQSKLEVCRKLKEEGTSGVIESSFTYRHVHRDKGWVWVEAKVITTSDGGKGQPCNLRDGLMTALGHVVVRSRPMGVAT